MKAASDKSLPAYESESAQGRPVIMEVIDDSVQELRGEDTDRGVIVVASAGNRLGHRRRQTLSDGSLDSG